MKNDIPLIKYKDGYRSLEEIADTFTVNNDENTVKNPILIRKGDGQRFYYLESGLTEHDFESEMRPYKIKKATGQCWVEFVCTDHGNTTTPGGISRLIGAHAWIRLENKIGSVYSVGRIASQIVCPDPFEYSKRHQLIARIQIDSLKFNKIFYKIHADVKTDQKKFNLLKDNCSVFTYSIAQMLFPNLNKTPFEPWGSFNNIELDIKLFSIATDITKLIESNRSKFLEFAQELENQNGDALKAIDIFAESQLKGSSQTKTYLKSLLFILSETRALKTTDAFGAIEYIQETSRKLNSWGDKNSILSMTYNLMKDIQESLKEFSIAHPYTLHLHLKELPGVKELKFKPKNG